MGEIADQIIDRMLDGLLFGGRRRSRGFHSGIGKGKWRSANGGIWVRDMSRQHIENAIDVCLATNNTGKLRELRDELDRRDNALRKLSAIREAKKKGG